MTRCQYCDGTGDVHSADGEWRGPCTCPAAVLADAADRTQELQMKLHGGEFDEYRAGLCLVAATCKALVAPQRQVGWYYENLSSGSTGFLGMRTTEAAREEWRRAEYAVWPMFIPRGLP